MFSSPIFGDMFLLDKLFKGMNTFRSFRLLYSEICSYSSCGLFHLRSSSRFSSPIFGDMFLLLKVLETDKDDLQFSSPIFGDMFLLLRTLCLHITRNKRVFVSYIRRYVLTTVR